MFPAAYNIQFQFGTPVMFSIGTFWLFSLRESHWYQWDHLEN